MKNNKENKNNCAKPMLAAVPKLIKAKSCGGCWAYEDVSFCKGSCVLGFNVEQLGKNPVAGKFGGGQYWSVYCKPAEPCMKPKTSREYVTAFKARHGS
jgi:hypothetical protein